ncbi:SDR family oxidoreductase [Brachyspira hampsonii]|uniref:Short-chain dehydrogenase n=1 Tax=Brachyspira hampsonii TaxID=1287055 RepID=A0AAC9TWD8_9SPIR|nr:SDR family oxidoreductase [Brachyspira hampsonii]ASJ22567.1 short-chain dehydrogenase [Brachyspira hampsonii]ELV04819.1 short chain dehydrogenase [Brachyspira hampsonii 30599]MBW5380280.1 SDR family oxidoreductase [Brachyspira hampsonii]OEJ17802.1 short-chain dehydrogenase [Brachyspira hampsonii]
MNNKKDVFVLTGSGSIGIAIARRMGIGKHIVLSDLNIKNAERESQILYNAGFQTSVYETDISSRESILKLINFAKSFGKIKYFVNAAGVSPSQASIEDILKVDLYGTAVLLEEFGKVVEEGGSGITISSQSGYRLGSLTDEENKILATTPTEKLLSLPILDKATDTLKAYQLSKRCNCLRVMYESGNWGKRGARLNSISPGIIITPLANDELNGPRGESYRKMLELCPSKRAGTPDDVANVAELLMSDRGSFISGSDFLMDGGVTASWWYGELSNNK